MRISLLDPKTYVAATAGAVACLAAAAPAQTSLQDATPGQIVTDHGLELSEDAIPRIDVQREPGEDVSLILSDKPEYFRTGNGVALREDIEPGRHRFYLYHVPEPTGEKKTITAWIENRGDQPLTIDYEKSVFPKIGGDYHRIGKEGLVGFLGADDRVERSVELPPGSGAAFDPALEGLTATKDQLVHGFYQFTTDQPARLWVLQRDPGQHTGKALDQLELLPQVLPGFHPSGAGRGVFPRADFTVTPVDEEFEYRTSMGPRQVILADGETDPWIQGHDGISGEAILNKGNYGVTYRISLPWDSDDGRGVAVLVYNSRAGGQWCGYQATALHVSDGVFPAGVVAAPSEQQRHGAPPEAVLIQRYAAEDAGTIELTFSPPGASCLPVPIVLLPIDAASPTAAAK